MINKKNLRCIKAIIAIDLFGHVCNYDKTAEVAKHYNIPIIQDAAQSFALNLKTK